MAGSYWIIVLQSERDRAGTMQIRKIVGNITNPALAFERSENVTILVVNVDAGAPHSLGRAGFGKPYAYNIKYGIMSSFAAAARIGPSSGMYTGQGIRFTAARDRYYICAVSGQARWRENAWQDSCRIGRSFLVW